MDAKGNITQYEYDTRLRVVKQTDAEGHVTNFSYNARGDRTSVVDALGNTTSFSFDGNGRKIQEVRTTAKADASGNHTAVSQVLNFQYDAADHLIKEAKLSQGGDSRVSVYQFDQFDHIIRKTLGIEHNGVMSETQDDATYSYESQLDAELMTSAVNGVSMVNFTNEAAPPFVRASFGIHASNGNPYNLQEMDFDLDRDVTGNIAAVRSQGSDSSILTQAFDPAGRLIGIQVGSYKLAVGYDGFGRKNRVAGSDGVAEEIYFDALNRTRQITWTKNFAKIFQENINYDKAGNPFEISNLNGSYDFSFDKTNQLVKSKTDEGVGFTPYNRAWQFDNLGNKIVDSKRGAGSFVANFETSDGKGNYFADQEGFGALEKEVLKDGTIRQYTYRADGKKASMQDNHGNSEVYHYDALGRLVAKSITTPSESNANSFTYLADTNSILYAKDGVGVLSLNIEGQNINEHLATSKLGGEINTKGDGLKTFISDHLGSVLNSEIAKNMQYGVQGEILGKKPELRSTTNPLIWGFAGYMYDVGSHKHETFMRTYDQERGVWTNQDPIGLAGGDENLYRYAGNQFQLYTDPYGLDVKTNGYKISLDLYLKLVNLNQLFPKQDIIVTGGDRYRDSQGKIRSSTNDKLVKNSATYSKHIAGEAVDFTVTNTPDKEAAAAALNAGFDWVKTGYDNAHVHADIGGKGAERLICK